PPSSSMNDTLGPLGKNHTPINAVGFATRSFASTLIGCRRRPRTVLGSKSEEVLTFTKGGWGLRYLSPIAPHSVSKSEIPSVQKPLGLCEQLAEWLGNRVKKTYALPRRLLKNHCHSTVGL